jgi:lipoprotein-anchoring transpeptidase ErfK/SrfK
MPIALPSPSSCVAAVAVLLAGCSRPATTPPPSSTPLASASGASSSAVPVPPEYAATPAASPYDLGPSAAPLSPLPAPSGPPPNEQTLRTQVLLDRAHFSPGEIDGRDGENTRRALARYKRQGGAPQAGGGLETDPTPHLVDYTVTARDVAGPFTPIPEDMMEKAKLPALAYASLLEALGERFHSSPALLQRLNPQATFSRAGERIRVPNVHTAPPGGKATRVVVDGSGPSVAALDGDRVLAVYPATAGSQHDPLPIGSWKVNGVSRNPTFNYNPDLFWDAEEGHGKARIPSGPNNPVGVVWVDLSKPHYGIHGTPEPSTIDKTQSHGCIRLTNWDAEELAGMVAAGTPVVIRK